MNSHQRSSISMRGFGYLLFGLSIISCLALFDRSQALESNLNIQPLESILDSANSESSRNACSLDSTRENCLTDQNEQSHSYRPISDDMPTSKNAATITGREYVDDRLSADDKLQFKGRDADYWRSPDQETLRQVLFIHRHGDRTPINFPPKDPLTNEPFWKFHGLGQLTNRGKARLHLLGKIVRQRYDKFLDGSVNKNYRKSRASGSLRCIESAQMFLSSFLALDKTDCPDGKALEWDTTANPLSQIWQPASVNTLAAKYDGMLNEGSQCATLYAEYNALDESNESKELLKEFKHEVQVLKDELGFEIDHFYKWFWASSQLEVERSYFGYKMSPAVLAIYDRLEIAGNRALVMYQSSLKLRRARVGMLIDDMIKNMLRARTSDHSTFTKKFVHYSAHDINLIFLLGILDNIDKFPIRPDYASNIMIELHQEGESLEWFVKIFYMQKVPSKPMELHIDACEQGNEKHRCTLTKFMDLMQKYRVTSWINWMQECGNFMGDIDPYSENS